MKQRKEDSCERETQLHMRGRFSARLPSQIKVGGWLCVNFREPASPDRVKSAAFNSKRNATSSDEAPSTKSLKLIESPTWRPKH